MTQKKSNWLKMKNKMTQSDSLSRHILINIDQNYFQYWSILISILINIDFQCINIDHILFQYWSILKVENQNSPKIAHWGYVRVIPSSFKSHSKCIPNAFQIKSEVHSKLLPNAFTTPSTLTSKWTKTCPTASVPV